MEKTAERAPHQKVVAAVLALVLAVTMIPAEALTAKAYAAEPQIRMGVTQSGSFAKEGEIHAYRFVMPASGQLSISGLMTKMTNKQGVACASVRICRQDGTQLFDRAVLFESQERVGFTMFLNKGEYILEVDQALYTFLVQYNLTLNCKSANESFTEGPGGSNNTFDTANAIRANVTYRGLIASDDTRDMYRITVPSRGNKRLIFNINAEDNGFAEIEVYDSSRVKLKSWVTMSAINGEPIELAAGTYYVSVGAFLNNDGYAYSFQLADPLPLSKVSVRLSQTKYDYAGRAFQPVVSAFYGGTRLVSGTDYTVSYSANKNAGIGKVAITGLGAYAGRITKAFTIRPTKPSMKSVKAVKGGFKATWRKKSRAEATGFQVQYSTSKSMKKAKTKAVKGTSKTIKGLKKGKRYYVRVRAYKTVGKTKVYSAWSSKTRVTTKKR